MCSGHRLQVCETAEPTTTSRLTSKCRALVRHWQAGMGWGNQGKARLPPGLVLGQKLLRALVKAHFSMPEPPIFQAVVQLSRRERKTAHTPHMTPEKDPVEAARSGDNGSAWKQTLHPEWLH